MTNLQQAIKDAHLRIDSQGGASIPGNKVSIGNGFSFSAWYWISRVGLVEALTNERVDANQKWFGFILGYCPADHIAVREEFYLSSPGKEVGIRQYADSDTQSILLMRVPFVLIRNKDFKQGLIEGINKVPGSHELPKVETNLFKEFIKQSGSRKVIDRTNQPA